MADEQRTLAVNLTANASGFANGTNEAIQKLKELNTQVAENKQNIKQTSAEMKEYQRKLSELKAATDGGKKATEEEKQEMQRLRDAIARCAADIGSYQTAQQRLQSQIRNTNRELDEQRGSAEKVNEAFSTMGEVLKANLLSGAITTALEKLTGALQTCASYAYNVGSRFEAGMSQVKAISGASGATLDELTEKAKALGASTRFSASEAAQAMNYMAMAGWDAEQMLSGIDGVLSLAAASGADLGETADIVTDAITAFGLAAEDVGHFSDVLAAASANANTNVSMLGESFKYVAPLAGTMGYSIDEVAEALGIMANSGIKASTAGTSMRTILTNLTSGVTVSAEAFGEMEITAANADGSMKSLNEVLGELREAFALMTDAEKTTNGNLIAGDRALSGFLSLVNAAPADIDKLRTAIENADGAAGNMAQTMTENVAGSVTIMNSALESLGIAVFEKFGDRINDVVVKITNAVTDLSERIDGGELDDTFESLAALRDEYLDVGTDKYEDATDKIYVGMKKLREQLAKEGLGLGDAAADDAEKVKEALSDIQQSYKDTLAEIDNPNLLVNPDFAINQRGSTSYSSADYTVDDWLLSIIGNGNSGSYDAKTHVLSGSVLDTDGYFANMQQYIEDPERFAGKVMTLSASISELNKPALIQVWRTGGTTTTSVAYTSYNLEPDKVLTFTMPSDLTETSKIRMVLQTRGSVKLNWAKLEIGGIATPFVPPDPATELAKCHRYYQIRSTGDIAEVDLRPTMRATPTVTQLSDGNYAYSAEL